MVALVEIGKEITKVDLFFNKEGLEIEMKRRYNERTQKAKNINWSNTFFDEKRMFAQIDEWDSIIEYRSSEIQSGIIREAWFYDRIKAG